MIVNKDNTNNNAADPGKKINATKAYEYLKSISNENGLNIEENLLKTYSNRSDLKDFLPTFFYLNDIEDKIPNEQEMDSIFNSWVDQPDIEKKNLVGTLSQRFSDNPNVVDESDSQSTSVNEVSSSGLAVIKIDEQGNQVDAVPQDGDDAPVSIAPDAEVASKKGLDMTTEMQSYEEEPSYESWVREVDAKGVGGFIDEKKYLSEVINSIPKDLYTLSESDARRKLSGILRPYGFKVDETDAGADRLLIEAPNGSRAEFRLFTEGVLGYQNRLEYTGQTEEEVDALLNDRFESFKDFILSNGSPVDDVAVTLSQSKNLPYDIETTILNSAEPSRKDLLDIAGFAGVEVEFFYEDGVFQPARLKSVSDDIIRIYNSNSPLKLSEEKGYDFVDDFLKQKQDAIAVSVPAAGVGKLFEQDEIQGVFKRVEGVLSEVNRKISKGSQLIGSALGLSGEYKNIDLNNPDLITKLSQSGLRMVDMPLDGIVINGVPSSIRTLEAILTNPSGRNDIIRGKISVNIGNPDDYGLLAPYVQGAKSLLERNEATATKTAVGAEAKIFYEWGEDFLQGVGISSMEILSNIGSSFSDALQAAGVPEFVADGIVYGNGLPLSGGFGFTPKEISEIKEEYLPLYNKSVSDANSFGELLALVNEPMAASLPYMALYSLNPALGLSVTGVSTYGSTINEVDMYKEAVKSQLEEGALLTKSQMDILGMSDNKARLLALSTAATEVAITRMFTYNFFKQTAAAKNFKGVKSLENVKKISDQYGRRINRGIVGKFAQALGIDAKALRREIPEESSVALSNYFLKVHFGLEEYDEDKAIKLVKDTGITSVFSSSAMSRIARGRQNSKIRKVTNQIIKNNLVTPGDKSLYRKKILLDAEMAAMKKQGLDGANDPQVKAFEVLRQEVNEAILTNEKRKDQLLAQMTPSDKAQFMELVTVLEESRRAIDNSLIDEVVYNQDVRNDIRSKAVENIGKTQDKLRSIIAKYPSLLSYSYAKPETRLKYDEAASKQLQKEAEDRGEQDFTINQDQISERAAKIYLKDILDAKAENEVEFTPADSYTIDDPTLVMTDIDETTFGDFKLSTAIKRASSKRQAKPEQPTLELDVEGAPDASVTDTDIVQNPERVNSIVSRLESSLKIQGDIMNRLPRNQANQVIKFFDDLERGRSPQYGQIEAILNANDIALAIAAKTNSKIDIFEGGSVDKSLNALGQKLVTTKAGFGTGDILLKTLFRNTEQGSEFYDLYRNMIRKVNVAELETDKQYNETLKKYKERVIAYNKKLPVGQKRKSENANELDNSYELYMLAGALRQSGVKDKNGVDLEFSRWKSLLKQELDLRKADLDGAGTLNREKFEQRFLTWKSIYDKLGVETAKSFDDLATKADSFNVDFINELAAIQPGEAALTRITDFGGSIENKNRGTQKPFVDGTYVPVPFTKKADDLPVSRRHIQDALDQYGIGPNISDASNLREISFVESLGDGLRLNPGLFAKNAFAQMRGSKMDIDARGDMVTLQYLLENDTFKSLFSDEKQYDLVASYFRSQNESFNDVVRGGSEVYVDIGSKGFKDTLKKAETALYSAISSVSLARVSQRSSQFVSATAGTIPYIKSKAARAHLTAGSRNFVFGMSSSANGAKSKTQLGSFIQNSLFGRGDLSNIYSLSRTGMRNAIKAEFNLSDKGDVPTSYILDYLNVKDEDGTILSTLGPKTTIDLVLDFVSKGSEMSLDLFLGSADQAAANLAFESHYIQARENQGVDFSTVKSMKEWWKKENENPNVEAINKADAMVAQTMRQTGKLGESAIYQGGNQTLVRLFFPFQKFVSNARANFANQYAILNDPTIPESQKKEARAAIAGLSAEIASFQIIKLGFGLSQMKGFSAGILGFGVDEEDIKREGGYTQLIGADILPIEDRPGVFEDLLDLDREFSDLMQADLPVNQRETKESEFIAAKMTDAGATLEKAAYFIDKYAREYDKKFRSGKSYPILMPVLQDMGTTFSPVPFTQGADDLIFFALNKILDDDLFTEYVSADLEKIDTKEGKIAFIASQTLGIFGIGVEQANKIAEAKLMRDEHLKKINGGEYGTINKYVGGGASISRSEKVDNATNLLLMLRTMQILAPGAPKGDINKLGNYLERALENEFAVGSKPDPLMQQEDQE